MCRPFAILAVLAMLVPAVSGAVKPDPALERIRRSMSWLAGSFKDLETDASLIIAPPTGTGDARQQRTFNMSARVYVKMPDKVKFQVLSSSLPLFNRWIFLQNGDEMSAYDPIGDRQLATDFRRLTGREPVRIDTTLNVLGVMFDPSKYRYNLVGKTTLGGRPVWHVRIAFSPPRPVNAYTTIAYTDLYVDASRVVPLLSRSYTPDKQLATSTTFSDFIRAPRGWAPGKVTIADVRAERFLRRAMDAEYKRRADAARKAGLAPPPPGRKFHQPQVTLWLGLKGDTLFPKRIHSLGFDGASSQWTFSSTKVNSGLKDKDFRL